MEQVNQDIVGWGWLTYAIINIIFFAVGWMSRQVQFYRLMSRNEWQGDEILKLSAVVEQKNEEMRLLKECRFHGGEPPLPQKPSMFGQMIYTPQLNQKIVPGWTAEYVRKRALALLG